MRGFVRDSTNGEVLLYANVFIEGTKTGVATDLNGFFIIQNITPGKYNLVVSYIGFQTKNTPIEIFPHKTTELTIHISPGSVGMEDVVKIGENITRPNETDVGLHTITRRELEIIPKGVEQDVLRMLQTIPGVKSTSDISSRFYVRGGGTDQNLVLINGATVYNPYHALGIFSLIDPEIINIVQFYKGGIPTEYGGRLSSVLAIKTKDGNRNRFAATGNASFLAGKMTLEGPIPHGSFIVSGRKSYFGGIYKKFLNKDAPFDFYDFTAKLNYSNPDLINNSKFSFHTLISNDDIKYNDPSREDFKFGNNLFGMEYYQVWEKPLFSHMNFSLSKYEAEVIPNESGANLRRNRVSDFSWGTHFTYLYESRDELSVGNQIKYFDFLYSFNNLTGVSRTYEGIGVNFDFFAKYKFLRWEKLGIETGVRLSPSRMTSNPGPVLFPNVNITYRPVEKVGLKGAFGVLRQEIIAYTDDNEVISIFEPYMVLPDYLSPARAIHYSLGVEYNIAREASLEIEGYYKQLINVPDLNRGKVFATDPDMISVEGESYGAEFLFKHMTPDFYTSAAYTLSWAHKGRGEDKYFPRYDTRHNVNIIFGMELGSGWSTSANFAFSSGLPFTQSAGFYDKLYTNNFWDPWLIMQPYLPYTLLGERNVARLPVYHRIDLNLSKKFVLFFMTASFEINVLNIYNRKNIFYFDRVTGERINMLPFLPTAALRIEI